MTAACECRAESDKAEEQLQKMTKYAKFGLMLAAFLAFYFTPYWMPEAAKPSTDWLLNGLYLLYEYAYAHTLTCLLPAFFIAGAVSALAPKESITRYLGQKTPKHKAYPLAILGGLLLAVCSCTILPLFAGIKKKGAGLGPAIAFLYTAPATNILAIVFTGGVLGWQLAGSRIILSVIFAVLIGVILTTIFKEEEPSGDGKEEGLLGLLKNTLKDRIFLLTATLVLVLTMGTRLPDAGKIIVFLGLTLLLRIAWPLKNLLKYRVFLLIAAAALLLITATNSWIITELIVTEAILVFLGLLLLLMIAWSLRNILKNRIFQFTATLVLILIAGTRLSGTEKTVVFLGLTSLVILQAIFRLSKEEAKEWLSESYAFTLKIFPLLLVGVFFAGALSAVIPENFLEKYVGGNSIPANLLATLFGVVMYFPTLAEVPMAQMFLAKGMGNGPLLAYLLADPVISLPSILVVRGLIGTKKTAVYVALIIFFCTPAGLIYGTVV